MHQPIESQREYATHQADESPRERLKKPQAAPDRRSAPLGVLINRGRNNDLQQDCADDRDAIERKGPIKPSAVVHALVGKQGCARTGPFR